MNVPFCNSNAFKIDSPELKERVYLECEKLFEIKIKRDYFPGPQPVTVEMKDIPKLNENYNSYMVCEKTDGERAILLLINIDNKPMCFIINRNNELYFMDLSFKKEVFEGSIFVYNGTSFLKENHRLRYACIIDFILKRYVNKETDCFNIKTKLFYNYGPLVNKTWEHIQKTTENKIDGLNFTPIDHPVVFGRDYSLLKWKELHTRTIVNGIPTEDIHLTSELKNGVTELSGTVNGKKVFITRPHQPISQLLFPKKSVRFMEDEASFPSEILPIDCDSAERSIKSNETLPASMYGCCTCG